LRRKNHKLTNEKRDGKDHHREFLEDEIIVAMDFFCFCFVATSKDELKDC
jgi:hypothetical protein